jgi:hypothetical protein
MVVASIDHGDPRWCSTQRLHSTEPTKPRADHDHMWVGTARSVVRHGVAFGMTGVGKRPTASLRVQGICTGPIAHRSGGPFSAGSVGDAFLWRSDGRSRSEDGLATCHRNGRARHIARVVCGQHHVDRRQLLRLSGTLHGDLLAEFLHLLGRHGGGN